MHTYLEVRISIRKILNYYRIVNNKQCENIVKMFKYLGNGSRIKISSNKFKTGVSVKGERIMSVVTTDKDHYITFSLVFFAQCIRINISDNRSKYMVLQG